MATQAHKTDGGTATSAGQLLVTVLGDYWFATTEHIASAALVAIMAEFGVSEDAVRAALSRLCRDGRLERVKDGRRTAYRLSPAARALATDRGRRLVRYGARPVDWDGQWTCVAFSVPEADRPLRSSFRNRLRMLGMGPLFDGLWVSPHPILDAVDRALDELGIHSATVLRATEVPGAGPRSRRSTHGTWRACGPDSTTSRSRSPRCGGGSTTARWGRPRRSSCAPT